jgi:predicted O-methyltransferase YrrM
MRTGRADLIDTIWHGLDPFADFPGHLYEVDLQGWGENHPYLAHSVAEIRPRIIVEVGVWKGASVATMAATLKEHEVDGLVVAVDTWLGSHEHWTNRQWFDNLSFEHGRPALQKKFMANMLAKGLHEYVVPLPLDSLNAAQLLSRCNIRPDLLHLDGGHDYASVAADLRAWWPLVRPGGILIGDDYNTNGVWPEVRQAFDEFFSQLGITSFEVTPPKCRIRKPTQFRSYEMFEPAALGSQLRRVTLGAPQVGDDEDWCPVEGTRLQPYRWLAGGNVSWKVNIPANPAATFQVKIPYVKEAHPGLAAGCSVLIAGHETASQARESAILARMCEVPPGTVTIELRAPKQDEPVNQAASFDRQKVALAIRVMT